VVPTDERHRGRRLRVHAETAAGTKCTPDREGLRLPLDRYRRQLLVLDGCACCAVRLLPDHESADRRFALEASGGVDDVAGGDALALTRSRPKRDDCLARRHGRAHCELQPLLCVQLLDRVEDAKRGPDGSLGVVLVGDRSSEDGHDRIADELLDGAAEALDLPLDSGMVRVARTSSGSDSSERAVKPTRSTNSTETSFRSSPTAGASARAAPHALQKRAPSGFSSPQLGQLSTGQVYDPLKGVRTRAARV